MRVRDATISDLDAIVDFIAEEAREAEGRTQDEEPLRRGVGEALREASLARYWLLVDEQDNACGCTSVITEWSDWNGGFYWWVQSMYIAPEHRGKDYLNTLVDCVTEAAREAGCLDLRLYVHRDNRAAIRAYEKVGFDHSAYRIMSKPV
ncbi:MAG: GNAT family N-acetyltransferase [Pseudomonadota bacterium]